MTKPKSQYKSWLSVWVPFGLWRIDWYFIRAYVKVLLIILLALAALVGISDLFQRFDDFVILSRREDLDYADTIRLFLRFYGSFIPQLIFQYMFPLSMLLAASITVTAAYAGPRGNNEYLVTRSAGIPVLRSFFPLVFPALIIAIAFQAGRDFFLPSMVRESSAIINRLKGRRSQPTSISLIGPDGFQSAAIGWFDPDRVAHNVIVEVRDPDRFHQGDASQGDNDFVAYRAAAARLAEAPDGEYQWIPLEKAKVQIFTRFSRREADWTEPIRTNIAPAMIERQTLGDAVSSWRELLVLQNDNTGAKFEIFLRLADPVACCLLIIFGTGLCMGLMLRGRSTSFIYAVTISMLAGGVFYGLRLVGRSLWEAGSLTPEQGVWYPIAATALLAIPIAWWMER